MCHLKHKSKLDSIEIHRLAAAKEGPFFSSQENINIQNPILGFDTALLLPPQQTSLRISGGIFGAARENEATQD